MSEAPQQPNASLPPSPFRETPAEHITCVGCQYDLVGLGASESCPECDLAVEESIQSLRLMDAPSSHILRLLRGIRLIQIGVFLLVPAAILLGVVGTALISFVVNLGPANIPRPPLADRLITGLMLSVVLIPSMLCTLPLLWGHWNLTHPLKTRSGKSRGNRLRSCIRGMLLWIALSPFLLVAAAILEFELLVWCAFGAWLLGHLGAMSASLLYMSMLARQIPADRPARLARLLAWIIPVTVVAISFFSVPAGYIGFIAYAVFAIWFRSFIVSPKQQTHVDAVRST